MGWERRFLLDQETQSSDDTTRRIKLPRAGNLSALEMRIRITNGSTAGEQHIIDAIDRVEVIGDGSFVIMSLTGVELLRWCWADLKRFPQQDWNEAASAVQELVLPIMFGRFIGDPELALDLAAFRDIELRIQYSPTIAATSFATGTTQLHVVMVIDEQGDASRGGGRYLRTQQVKNFTSAASGVELTEMARQHPYYSIGVYVREAAIADGVDITRARLNVNNGQHLPFDGYWDDIQGMNEQIMGIDPWVSMRANRGDDAAIDMLTGRLRDHKVSLVQNLAAADDFALVNVGTEAGDRITIHLFVVEGSATYAATILKTSRSAFTVAARGLGVGNFILIPFSLTGDLAHVMDPTSLARLELELTQGGAGAEVRISTRELMSA